MLGTGYASKVRVGHIYCTVAEPETVTVREVGVEGVEVD